MTEPLLGAREIRELAERLGIRPTKKLGQNFVIDPNTCQRIVRAANLQPDDRVLEVGPGLGSLTLALLEDGHRVTAVEIDPPLAAELPSTVRLHQPGHVSNLAVVNADALAVTVDDLAVQSGDITALVANLPYNVAVPVLLHLLEIIPTLRTVLVMVQKEVAERLAAEPGSKVYGVPSVKARWYGAVEYAGNIGPKVFWPEPNVDSGLVRITRQARVEGDGPTRSAVFGVVDAAFGQRRKALRGALAGLAGSPDASERALVAAGISPLARGESLTLEDFIRLTGTLSN